MSIRKPSGPTNTLTINSSGGKKIKPLSFKRKKKSSPFQKAADGMKVQGPSHEEGGIEAQAQGQPVAEIEGDERIFSQEDTQYLENSARQIVRALQQDPQRANQMAQALGFKVVEMIIEQERNQREQEGREPENEEDMNQAMNSFENAPDNDNFYSEQPE